MLVKHDGRGLECRIEPRMKCVFGALQYSKCVLAHLADKAQHFGETLISCQVLGCNQPGNQTRLCRLFTLPISFENYLLYRAFIPGTEIFYVTYRLRNIYNHESLHFGATHRAFH